MKSNSRFDVDSGRRSGTSWFDAWPFDVDDDLDGQGPYWGLMFI